MMRVSRQTSSAEPQCPTISVTFPGTSIKEARGMKNCFVGPGISLVDPGALATAFDGRMIPFVEARLRERLAPIEFRFEASLGRPKTPRVRLTGQFRPGDTIDITPEFGVPFHRVGISRETLQFYIRRYWWEAHLGTGLISNLRDALRDLGLDDGLEEVVDEDEETPDVAD